MSRALLLVIADFLLISLLALARFDLPEDAKTAESDAARLPDKNSEMDLIEVLELSLEAEQEQRSELQDAFEQTRVRIDEQEQNLDVLSSKLAESLEALDLGQTQLDELTEERNRLELDRAGISKRVSALETERASLSDQVRETQELLETNKQERAGLGESLSEAREAAAASGERSRMLQELLQARNDEVNRREKALRELEDELKIRESEKQRLATELQVREIEKQLLEQNLTSTRTDLEAARQEKDTLLRQADQLAAGVSGLAQGVTTLTRASTAIQEEIRLGRPLSSHAIFAQSQEQQMQVVFKAESGGAARERIFSVPALAVSDGSRNYAILHTRNSPFRLDDSAEPWKAVTAVVEFGGERAEVKKLGFLGSDPRLLTLHLPEDFVEVSKVEAFSIAADPFRFPEAILVGSEKGYYGESPFKIGPDKSHLLRLQTRLFNRLFGEFSPSRGDLVFTKSGKILGLMVNNQYCLRLGDFRSLSLALGDEFDAENGAKVVSTLSAWVGGLPSEYR